MHMNIRRESGFAYFHCNTYYHRSVSEDISTQVFHQNYSLYWGVRHHAGHYSSTQLFRALPRYEADNNAVPYLLLRNNEENRIAPASKLKPNFELIPRTHSYPSIHSSRLYLRQYSSQRARNLEPSAQPGALQRERVVPLSFYSLLRILPRFQFGLILGLDRSGMEQRPRGKRKRGLSATTGKEDEVSFFLLLSLTIG